MLQSGCREYAPNHDASSSEFNSVLGMLRWPLDRSSSVHVTCSSEKICLETPFFWLIWGLIAGERAFSSTWLIRRDLVWRDTSLPKLAPICRDIPAAVSKRFPIIAISNVWIMRSSRGLVLCGRLPFFVEWNELVPLCCFKIIDMTLLERPTSLPIWPKGTVNHFSSERLSVGGLKVPCMKWLGILQKWLGQWSKAVTWPWWRMLQKNLENTDNYPRTQQLLERSLILITPVFISLHKYSYYVHVTNV